MQVQPEIYESTWYTMRRSNMAECENSPACASVKHHFDECQERVTSGKGFEGEDCTEELYVFRCSDTLPAVCYVVGLADISPPRSLRAGVHCSVRGTWEADIARKLFAKLV